MVHPREGLPNAAFGKVGRIALRKLVCFSDEEKRAFYIL